MRPPLPLATACFFLTTLGTKRATASLRRSRTCGALSYVVLASRASPGFLGRACGNLSLARGSIFAFAPCLSLFPRVCEGIGGGVSFGIGIRLTLSSVSPPQLSYPFLCPICFLSSPRLRFPNRPSLRVPCEPCELVGLLTFR